MVRKIIWTKRADNIFSEILEFYFKRNGTKIYSRKLNSEIKQFLNLLKKHPFIGKKTDTKNIRVFIKGNYKIFYRIEPTEIVIIMVWDCRQNPDNLKIYKENI